MIRQFACKQWPCHLSVEIWVRLMERRLQSAWFSLDGSLAASESAEAGASFAS